MSKSRLAATLAVVSQHMFVWMPQTTMRSIPSPRSHAARSGSPWNAEFTLFVTSRSGSPLRMSWRSLPGWPGLNGAPGLDQRGDFVLTGGVVPAAPDRVGEAVLDVDDDQRGPLHVSPPAPSRPR